MTISIKLFFRFILTAAHCTESFKRNGDKPVSFPRNILGLSFRCVYPDLLYNQMTYTAVVRQPSRCSGKLLSNKYKYVISAVHDHPRYRRLPNNELVFDFALLKTRLGQLVNDDDAWWWCSLSCMYKVKICRPLARISDRSACHQLVSGIVPLMASLSRQGQRLCVDLFQSSHLLSQISGYGRTTREQISGRDTTACKLMLATSQIYSASDRKCNMVRKSRNEWMKALCSHVCVRCAQCFHLISLIWPHQAVITSKW